jgi:hypothetical protein
MTNSEKKIGSDEKEWRRNVTLNSREMMTFEVEVIEKFYLNNESIWRIGIPKRKATQTDAGRLWEPPWKSHQIVWK